MDTGPRKEQVTGQLVCGPARRGTVSRRFGRRFLLSLLACSLVATAASAHAQSLDRIDVARYPKIREAERFQLTIAEKYYEQREWKVAMGEYEKYLTLYERSEAASYAQLKWSICQVQLRNLNTAITDGFQSVIDYWPESPDAVAAAYYIGKTWKDAGEIRNAKKAYQRVLADYEKHYVSTYAMRDLLEIANVEKDEEGKVKLWKQLAFSGDRTSRDRIDICTAAAQNLASHYFTTGAFDSGVESLQTSYNAKDIDGAVVNYARGAIGRLVADDATKTKGEGLANTAIAYVKSKTPADSTTPEAKLAALEYWYFVADLHASAARPEKVIETYEQILKTFGASDAALTRYAEWHLSQKQFDEGRKIYTRFENKIKGTELTAVSYRREQKPDPAVLAYRNLSVMDPDKELAWVAQIAATYDDFQQWVKAIPVYEELLAKDLENAERWRWAIAYDYHRAGKYREAIGYYRQCGGNYSPGNYFQMIDCHNALKEHNEAWTLCNVIVGSYPASAPQALLRRAYIEAKYQDKKEVGIKTYQMICKNFPKSSEGAQAHAILQKDYGITVTLGGAQSEK